MSAFDSGAFDAGAFEVPSGSSPQTLTQASRFDNGNQFFAATVGRGTVTLTPARYDNGQTFYAATVSQGGGPQTLLPGLYTNTQAFYAPTVTATRVLTPARFDNSNTFYAATVGRGPVNLSPARYNNGQAFYSATITATRALTPARFDNANAFYTPVVSQAGGPQFLAPNLYTNPNAFYGGLTTLYITFPDWVEDGWVEDGWVEWPYFNQNQFFAATVTQGPAPAADDQRGDGVDARWTKKQRKARDKRIEQEREDREKLRQVIEQIIDPQAPEPVEVVATEKAVKVETKTEAIVLPKLPTIDLAEVKREIMAAVANAQAARRAQEEAQAMRAEAQRVAEENIRKRLKRRRDEELLLLM